MKALLGEMGIERECGTKSEASHDLEAGAVHEAQAPSVRRKNRFECGTLIVGRHPFDLERRNDIVREETGSLHSQSALHQRQCFHQPDIGQEVYRRQVAFTRTRCAKRPAARRGQYCSTSRDVSRWTIRSRRWQTWGFPPNSPPPAKVTRSGARQVAAARGAAPLASDRCFRPSLGIAKPVRQVLEHKQRSEEQPGVGLLA